MLESRALRLLSTFKDDTSRAIDPLDFTLLLVLKERGYVEIELVVGKVIAKRTLKGKNALLKAVR